VHGSGAAGASNGSGERAGQEREVSSTCIHPTVEIQLCKKSSDCKFWTTNGSFLERLQVILAQKRVRVCRVWSMGSTAGTRVWGLGLGNACSITCSTNRLHGCKRWFSPPFVNRDEFRSRVQCAAAPSAR
jgi:hypothetical protein